MGLNIGGTGQMAAGMSAETARRLGVRTDYDRPVEASTGLLPAIVYPCYPQEVRLGDATANDVYCFASQRSASAPHGFDVLGHFAHCFFKPYHVTLDFTDMEVYIARGRAG